MIVCVCVCTRVANVSMLYKYSFGSKSIAIFRLEKKSWKAPSFLAEMTGNMEWKEDLGLKDA